MHELNLKTIKVALAIIIVSLVLAMISGIAILKNNYYWRFGYLKMQWNYVITELALVNRGIKKIGWSNNEKINSVRYAQSIPILLYHGVISDPDWQPDEVSIRLADFREQLFALKKAGWQTVTLDDYLAFSQERKELSEKSFLLTFDDGRQDSFYPVDPILRALNYTAVMNIITSRSLSQGSEKNSFHLSLDELKQMVASGRWQIESHGRDDHDYQIISPDGQKGHFLSDKKWLAMENRLETEAEFAERVRKDLFESKRNIEKILGTEVRAFAYPFGDFGQASINFPGSEKILNDITNSVYPLSFIQTSPGDYLANYPEATFLAKRININSTFSANDLLKIMENSQARLTIFADDFSENNGWLKGWGTFSIEKRAMLLGDAPDENSGLTFLDGAYLWQDYYAEAQANLLGGKAFAMSARQQDENNYVACDFSNNYVALTQRVNKQDQLDLVVNHNFQINRSRNIKIGIYVNGDQASCYLDGKKIVSGTINRQLSHGGIGFKVWNADQFKKGSLLKVKSLKVSPNLPFYLN